MSLYGYERSTTPGLEAWARRGITFDMARSSAPWTLPSHVSMFTGLLPSEHGACVDRCYYGAAPTMAEHLRAQGYTTAGIVANVRMCNTAYGVGRGFDHYVDYPWRGDVSLKAAMSNSALGEILMQAARRLKLPVPDAYPFVYKQPGSKIAAKGKEWLDRRRERDEAAGSDRPFFLFLNFMDVHAYYVPPAEKPRQFWTGPVPPNRDACPEAGWQALQARDAADAEHRPIRQAELDATSRRLGDLYDDCIAGLDAELGRFLGDLRDRGLLANTWLVITADHGEHFGEHGAFGHGSSLYNEQTHVPLILVPPLGNGGSGGDPFAGLRGRRIEAPVSLCELPRTMTDLLLPGSHNPFPGRGLARYWRAGRPGETGCRLLRAGRPSPQGGRLPDRGRESDRIRHRRRPHPDPVQGTAARALRPLRGPEAAEQSGRSGRSGGCADGGWRRPWTTEQRRVRNQSKGD